MAAPDSRFVRACKAMAVDRTPVWFMRQAGRYMAEYRAVRQKHSLIEICKNPQLAAEVTITADAFRREVATDRLLRRALHPRQLHD